MTFAHVDKEVESMLERGIVELAKGPLASGVVLARTSDGSLRFCVDYCP
jgi:hypothetical protein